MFKGEVELEAELEDLMSILAESELEFEIEAELTPEKRTRAREVAEDQVRAGVTDENRVTDAVFYDLNPTWKDKKLPSSAAKALKDEWTEIRNRIVRPLVKEMSCSGWEGDPESFAKRAAEHHLRGSSTVTRIVRTANPPNWACNVVVDGADGSTTLTVQFSPAEKLVRVGPASGGPMMCYQYRCVAANVVLQDAACPGPASEFEAELEDLMATLSASDLESEAEWEAEGAPRVPAGRCTPTGTRVGSLTCSDAEHTSVENLLQMSIPPATLRTAVETSAGAVVSLINTAAAILDRPSRTAASRAAFCAAFGVTPEFVPAWRSTLKGVVKWRDLGELVAIRLRDAAKIIDGGCIRYFC